MSPTLAARLAEEKEDRLAARAQRVERHIGVVQIGETERWSTSVDREPGRRRFVDNADLRLERIDTKQCPAMLAEQVVEHDDTDHGLRDDDERKNRDRVP